MNQNVFGLQNYKFSSIDQHLLRKGVLTLPFHEQQILIYRFWENLSIEEISRFLNLSWGEVDRSLEKSFRFLREFCLKQNEFSLSIFVQKELV